MKTINTDKLADLAFELTWNSEIGRHKETYRAENVNFWRDIFPAQVRQSLMGKQPGAVIQHTLVPEEMTDPYDTKRLKRLNPEQFQGPKINGRELEPRYGRFYPKGLIKGLPSVYPNNIEPCRCVDLGSSHVTMDLNHPLARKKADLEITVHDVRDKQGDRGGRLTDWMETLTHGPGMQVRSNGRPTDFFSDTPFVRGDEKSDVLFYQKPRLVSHVDTKAQEIIAGLYGKLLKPQMRVLDLMSSWQSHIPESLELSTLVGLGLNAEELSNNKQLTDYVVHDLNREPRLPFDDKAFDAVICSASVEYMIRPFEVFQDVARLLKPEGYFIQTFSNRWFPPKAINIWAELSEFERMGLTLEYFLRSGAYQNLETYSARGWTRPETDRYFPEIPMADPVYAVWGQTTG